MILFKQSLQFSGIRLKTHAPMHRSTARMRLTTTNGIMSAILAMVAIVSKEESAI